jgi:hypothetical protein
LRILGLFCGLIQPHIASQEDFHSRLKVNRDS